MLPATTDAPVSVPRVEVRIGEAPPFGNTYLYWSYFWITFFALGTSKALFGSDFELYLM